MRFFCTYFDHRYLNRGLALHRSLRKHCPDFRLWVLCLNDTAFELLSEMEIPEIEAVRLGDFEKRNPEMLGAKQNRSLIEYYFTCTAAWMMDVLTQNSQIDLLTYLDADLYFFESPDAVFSEMAKASIGIIPHRFAPRHRFLEKHGVFNVGCVSIRPDATGLACLSRWKNQCLEWCYDFCDGGRFADQKYLDEWPALYKDKLCVIQHPGADLAPWNVLNCRLQKAGGQVRVNGQPLVFYHFHGLKILRTWLFNPNLLSFGLESFDSVLKWIYTPYLNELKTCSIQYKAAPPGDPASIRGKKLPQDPQKNSLRARVVLSLKRWLLKQFVVFLGGRIF